MMKTFLGFIKLTCREHQILVSILGIGFLLRISGIFWGIPFPDTFEGKYHPDEGEIIQGAVTFPEHIWTNLRFVYPTFFHYFLGILILPFRVIFDGPGLHYSGGWDSNLYYVVTIFGRLCSVLAGTGTIFLTYLLTKEVFDYKRALLASAFLACTLYHITNSSFATTDVLTSFFLMLFLFLLRRAFSTIHVPSKFVFLGLALGLLVGTKYTGAIAGVAIVVMYGYTLFKQSRSLNQGTCNLRTLHFHLLLCGGTAMVTFLLTTPGIFTQFTSFMDSMAHNYEYLGRFSMPRTDLATWGNVFQKVGVAVGVPLAALCIWGLFFPFKKTVYEISYIVILIVFFLYCENRLFPRYVTLVAPLVAMIASNGAFWIYESRRKSVHILGIVMIIFVAGYSFVYSATGTYLRYDDTRTQAAHYIHETFPKGTTLGLGYTSERFGWKEHPFSYPKIDFTWFNAKDFLHYPEVVVVSSAHHGEHIQQVLQSEKLSPDYIWDKRYDKEWYEFSPPSPRVFRFYDELYDLERSQYTLLKTFKKMNMVPVEFGSPEIRIFIHRSYESRMAQRVKSPGHVHENFHEKNLRNRHVMVQ